MYNLLPFMNSFINNLYKTIIYKRSVKRHHLKNWYDLKAHYKSLWLLIFRKLKIKSHQACLNLPVLCYLTKLLQIFRTLQDFISEWWKFIDSYFNVVIQYVYHWLFVQCLWILYFHLLSMTEPFHYISCFHIN